MLEFTPSTATPYNPKRHVARLRRVARRRGFRVLKDWTSTWSLVDTRIAPPRALIGLWQVGLDEIDEALSLPLPTPKPRIRRPKQVRPTEPVQLKIIDAEFERVEPVSAEPLSPVEVLEQEFDVEVMFEKLRLLNAKAGGR